MNNDREFMIQKIRTQYTEKQITELDTLKRLDKKAKRPANIFAYVFGTVAALVMGFGMSLVMTELGDSLGIDNELAVGTVIGVVGMIMAIINYSIYKGILGVRKKKYAKEIIALSDRIMKG